MYVRLLRIFLMLQYENKAAHGDRHVRKSGWRNDEHNREEANGQTSQHLHVDEELGGANCAEQRKRFTDCDCTTEHSVRRIPGAISRLDR